MSDKPTLVIPRQSPSLSYPAGIFASPNARAGRRRNTAPGRASVEYEAR